VVRHLAGNGWLHLFKIEPQANGVEQNRHGELAAIAQDA